MGKSRFFGFSRPLSAMEDYLTKFVRRKSQIHEAAKEKMRIFVLEFETIHI